MDITTKALTKLAAWLVAAIALYLLVKWVIKKVKMGDVGKQWVDPSQLDPNKNYKNLAKAVHDAFDNWINSGEEEEAVCTQLNALNNNELKEVNNQYVSIYGNGTRSLQDAVTDYWVCFGCSNCKALAERLKTLLIN